MNIVLHFTDSRKVSISLGDVSFEQALVLLHSLDYEEIAYACLFDVDGTCLCTIG